GILRRGRDAVQLVLDLVVADRAIPAAGERGDARALRRHLGPEGVGAPPCFERGLCGGVLLWADRVRPLAAWGGGGGFDALRVVHLMGESRGAAGDAQAHDPREHASSHLGPPWPACLES